MKMNSILQSLYAPRFVISGRNALSHYGLCSFDYNVECVESNSLANLEINSFLDHIIYVHESELKDITVGFGGVRYASLNKSLLDALDNLYDDSILEDIFDIISDEQLKLFLKYLEKEGRQDVRERYSEFIF